MTGIPEGTTCQYCDHLATETVVDSVMDWVHGHASYLCKHCMLEGFIHQAEDMAAKIPGWREELKAACPPVEK